MTETHSAEAVRDRLARLIARHRFAKIGTPTATPSDLELWDDAAKVAEIYQHIQPTDSTRLALVTAADAAIPAPTEPPRDPDPVNHPTHYTRGPVEVIEIVEGFGLGFRLGNVVKYCLRAGHKAGVPPLVDLKKAQWYLAREIALLEKAATPEKPSPEA